MTYRKPDVPPQTEEEKEAFKAKLRGLRFGGVGMYVPHGKTEDSGRIKETPSSS